MVFTNGFAPPITSGSANTCKENTNMVELLGVLIVLSLLNKTRILDDCFNYNFVWLTQD